LRVPSIRPALGLTSLAGLRALPFCLTLAAQSWALECPVPHKAEGPGVLKETQAQIDIVGRILATGDLRNQTRLILTDLRSRYPGVDNGELVNYMITACPVIARLPGLSDTEKQAQVARFVAQLMPMVY
jgi:hypothetical protein